MLLQGAENNKGKKKKKEELLLVDFYYYYTLFVGMLVVHVIHINDYKILKIT